MFLIEMMGSIYYLNVKEVLKDKNKINPLMSLVEAYRGICQTHQQAVIQTMSEMIKRFLATPTLNLHHEIKEITYSMIFQKAYHNHELMDTLHSMGNWETIAGIKIHFYPRSLYLVYRALPYFDFSWARKELEQAMVIVKSQ